MLKQRLLSALLVALAVAAPALALPTSKLKNNLRCTGNLTVDGTSILTGATTQTGNFTVGGNLAVTGTSTHTGAVTNSSTTALTGVATGTAANVLTHAATSGLRILDTGSDHRISINATSNEAADRAISIPALGGNVTLPLLETANTWSGVQTFSTPIVAASINNSVKRQVQTVRLSPETGAAADSTVYRGIISFKRAGTVTGISYGAAVVPTSGTNVIAVEKDSFTGNTMLNAASVTLNSATIGQSATLTATGADLALTAEQVIAIEYNAGTQDVDAEQVFVSVEFAPTDF